MICQARGSAKEWPAVCSGVSQKQQVFTLGEDEGEAAIPASPRRQLWQIQDLLAFHDRLTATLQKHQLVRGRWGIVAHEQTTLCCQQQKPLLPLFENKSTCGEGERRKKRRKKNRLDIMPWEPFPKLTLEAYWVISHGRTIVIAEQSWIKAWTLCHSIIPAD